MTEAEADIIIMHFRFRIIIIFFGVYIYLIHQPLDGFPQKNRIRIFLEDTVHVT